MANPKRKHTRSRRDSRRSNNWKLFPTNTNKCPQCGAVKRPHAVCSSCGFYNGQLVIPVKTKKSKEKPEEPQ